jgi:single-strand DNA-binding protein
VIAALASGPLWRDPEQRTSKAGNPFATAKLKVRSGDGFQFVGILAFDEAARDELLRLKAGETVSVQGALKVETYVKDGETRISLTIMADHVQALHQPSRKRERAAGRAASQPARPRVNTDWANDEVPF